MEFQIPNMHHSHVNTHTHTHTQRERERDTDLCTYGPLGVNQHNEHFVILKNRKQRQGS